MGRLSDVLKDNRKSEQQQLRYYSIYWRTFEYFRAIQEFLARVIILILTCFYLILQG